MLSPSLFTCAGSVSSLWQQAGRAGRREQSSASIYIAFDGPLDQYFMTHPDRLFSRPIERAHVDAQNTQLLEQHVCCASAELPVILGQDAPFFGPKLERVMTNLHQQGGCPLTCMLAGAGCWPRTRLGIMSWLKHSVAVLLTHVTA